MFIALVTDDFFQDMTMTKNPSLGQRYDSCVAIYERNTHTWQHRRYSITVRNGAFPRCW